MSGGGESWFDAAFGAHYLTVYAHRDDGAARGEARFLAGAAGLARGDRILDLASGAGRHARAFARLGLEVIGVDRSRPLVVEARRLAEGPRYLRGDMRRLPLEGPFAAVMMLFSSFGYFPTRQEDLAVLLEAERVLRPGGRIVLDLMNRQEAIRGLVPESRRAAGAAEIHERRWITPDGRRVEKQVRLRQKGAAVVEYVESVRLYEPEEAAALLAEAGLPERTRFGDLAGAAFHTGSPRLVLVGERPC